MKIINFVYEQKIILLLKPPIVNQILIINIIYCLIKRWVDSFFGKVLTHRIMILNETNSAKNIISIKYILLICHSFCLRINIQFITIL